MILSPSKTATALISNQIVFYKILAPEDQQSLISG